MRLGGFVADNGRLPVNVRELLAFDADEFAVREGVIPGFAAVADVNSDCVQTSDGDTLGEPARLLKGHRGNYLAGVAHNGEFRDGWGNVGQGEADKENFGWAVDTTVSNELTITGLGADNELDVTGVDNEIAAENDQTMTIADADWRVPLDGWQVTVKNLRASSLDLSSPRAVVLVFENVGTNGRWLQYRDTSSASACSATLLTGESCVLTFAGTSACNSGSIAAKVPLGRHVLALADGDAVLAKTQVDFYPGTLPPPITLEVR
jgi:hypothetical protein